MKDDDEPYLMNFEGVMTVGKLKEVLNEFDDDLIVILSKDAEGNSFSPLPDDEFSNLGVYAPETTWCGEYRSGEDLEGDEKPNALCLWPIN